FSFRAWDNCSSKIRLSLMASGTSTEEAYNVITPPRGNSYAPVVFFKHFARVRWRTERGACASSRKRKKRYDHTDNQEPEMMPGKLLTSMEYTLIGQGGTSAVPGDTGRLVFSTGVGIMS